MLSDTFALAFGKNLTQEEIDNFVILLQSKSIFRNFAENPADIKVNEATVRREGGMLTASVEWCLCIETVRVPLQ